MLKALEEPQHWRCDWDDCSAATNTVSPLLDFTRYRFSDSTVDSTEIRDTRKVSISKLPFRKMKQNHI